MESVVFFEDCKKVMKQYPDKYFDLAVVDPPYGIGASEMTMGSGKNKKYSKGKKWDNEIPDKEYFNELFRVSKNQIIWGGNYFELTITRGWIFWDKGINGDCSFADGELALTSFDTVLRKANIRYKVFLGADTERIHETQKPVQLYRWTFKNYLPKGGKVIDTHFGSQSSRIAADEAGNIEFVGCENNAEHFNNGEKRFANYKAQLRLW